MGLEDVYETLEEMLVELSKEIPNFDILLAKAKARNKSWKEYLKEVEELRKQEE